MEYRFRGYDVTGRKGWVYGDLTHSKRILQGEPFLADRVMVGGYEVYPDSVGLASGIKDRSGSEIFVGDIVRIYDRDDDTSVDTEVMFERGIVGIPNDFGITTLSFFFHFWNGRQDDNDDNEYTVDVIGNVFENNIKK